MMGEEIKLSREVEAIAIPAGTSRKLAAGTEVVITQELGGTFTVHTPHEGGLYRIQGKDGDALGRAVSTGTKSSGSGTVDEDAVWTVLKTCYDPEIPVNIVDLGLVYDCLVTPRPGQGTHVGVKMTLTAPGCGMGPTIAAEAKQKVLSVPGVADADVELVWDPVWNQSMISEAGKMKLGLI